MHLGKPIKTSCRREKWGLLVQLSLFLLSHGGSLHSVSVCQMAPMHIKNAREVPEYEIATIELDFTGSVDITKKQKDEVGEAALKNLTLDSVKRRSIKPLKSLTTILSARSKLLVGLLQDQKILWSTLMHQTSTMN
nr:integrin-linked protein kinase 1-like [Tanacetum cinerariifolium]